MENAILIRKMTYEDAAAAAEIHQACFQGYFLTSLGVNILKIFYGECARSPYARCFVAMDGNTVAGFVIGMVELDSFKISLVRKKLFPIAWELFLQSVRKPSIPYKIFLRVKHLLRNFFIPAAEETPESQESKVWLQSIAVSPVLRRKKAGEKLVSALKNELRAENIHSMMLHTRGGNSAAIALFRKCGFEIQNVFPEHGEMTVVFGMNIPEPARELPNEYAIHVH